MSNIYEKAIALAIEKAIEELEEALARAPVTWSGRGNLRRGLELVRSAYLLLKNHSLR